MKQKNLKMLMTTVIFFMGYISYGQTPLPESLQPVPIGTGQPQYIFPFGSNKETNSSDNNNTSSKSSIGGYFKLINNYKTIGIPNNDTEMGKYFINKFSVDAEKGNEEKMFYLALAYRIYLHDEKNEIVWLDKLVAKNNDYALVRRGDLFEDANDVKSCIALYQKAVALNDTVAMVSLAEKYILHVRDEVNKPVELLEAAAAKHNIEACIDLANLFTGMFGKQYPIDYTKAMNLYLKSLRLSEGKKTNSDIAQRSAVMKSIATLYQNGNGVPKNKATSRHWMKKAKATEKD